MPPVLRLSAQIQRQSTKEKKVKSQKVFVCFLSQKSRKSEDECKVLSHVVGMMMMMKTNSDDDDDDDDDSFFSEFFF